MADLRGSGRWWSAVLVLWTEPVRGAADPPGGRDGADCSTRGWGDPADPPGREQGARSVHCTGSVIVHKSFSQQAPGDEPGALHL